MRKLTCVGKIADDINIAQANAFEKDLALRVGPGWAADFSTVALSVIGMK